MLRSFSAAAAVIVLLSSCLSTQQGEADPPPEIMVELLEPVLGPVVISVEAADGSTTSRRLVREVQSRLLRDSRSRREPESGGTPLQLLLGADLLIKDSKTGGMLSRGYMLTINGEIRDTGGRQRALLSGRLERRYSRFILASPEEEVAETLLETWDERFYRHVARLVYQELDSIYKK